MNIITWSEHNTKIDHAELKESSMFCVVVRSCLGGSVILEAKKEMDPRLQRTAEWWIRNLEMVSGCRYILFLLHYFFYFLISFLQWIAFISNTSISKRRPTRVSVHSLTSYHFRICRFQTQDQAVIQNIVVSTEQSLGVFQSNVMSYSTWRGGRGVRLIFQSTDHWHTIGVIQPSVRGRTREEKGTAFYAFPNYMFAELKGKEAGNVIIYQLPLSVCCTLEDISATLFIKKKKWACWILTWSVILGQDTLMGEQRHHNHCTDRSCSSCSPRALVLPDFLRFYCSIQCNSFKFHKNRIVSQERNCPFWKDTSGCIVIRICIYQNLSYRVTYKETVCKGCYADTTSLDFRQNFSKSFWHSHIDILKSWADA